MSIINATIAGGTRRMLQDILAWNHARSTDIQRVNAMAASGLVPKDSQGNLRIPADVLDGLWRPFPGSPPSMTSITAMSGDSQPSPSSGQPSPSSGQPSPSSGQPSPSSGQPSPPAPGNQTNGGKSLPWGKLGAALLAAALGSGGVGAALVSWLGSGGATTPVATTPQTEAVTPPNYQINETRYELRFGKLKEAE